MSATAVKCSTWIRAQAIYNLDHHWRNASTHDPTFGNATAIGEFSVNGKTPPLNGYL